MLATTVLVVGASVRPPNLIDLFSTRIYLIADGPGCSSGNSRVTGPDMPTVCEIDDRNWDCTK